MTVVCRSLLSTLRISVSPVEKAGVQNLIFSDGKVPNVAVLFYALNVWFWAQLMQQKVKNHPMLRQVFDSK